MELAEELRACLHDLSAGGTIEIRENGGRIPSARPFSWEVRGAPAKPLLHLWSETCNVTRRVLAITDQSEGRVLLAVECFGRTKPQRLEIIRLGYERDAKGLSREEFCEQLRRILVERFPMKRLKEFPSRRTWSIPCRASMREEFPAKGWRTMRSSPFPTRKRRMPSRAA
jgi:hypothetical protein